MKKNVIKNDSNFKGAYIFKGLAGSLLMFRFAQLLFLLYPAVLVINAVLRFWNGAAEKAFTALSRFKDSYTPLKLSDFKSMWFLLRSQTVRMKPRAKAVLPLAMFSFSLTDECVFKFTNADTKGLPES